MFIVLTNEISRPKLLNQHPQTKICKELNSFQNWWFAYDAIKNMIMQTEINVPYNTIRFLSVLNLKLFEPMKTKLMA